MIECLLLRTAGAETPPNAHRSARQVPAVHSGEGEGDAGGAHGGVARLGSGTRGADGAGLEGDDRGHDSFGILEPGHAGAGSTGPAHVAAAPTASAAVAEFGLVITEKLPHESHGQRGR